MLCLGLTGGIGSGKSYVSKVFLALGIAVYEADMCTKLLYDKDEGLRKALIVLLGEEIYAGGMLQRAVMAAKIFSDKSLLQKVNDLVHPAVMQDFALWKMEQEGGYVIMESAILLETPFAYIANQMLTVTTPMDLRIKRLLSRDQTNMEEVKRRMDKQWSDEMREAKSDFVVHSDGHTPLLPQILKVHEAMLFLNEQKNGCRKMD